MCFVRQEPSDILLAAFAQVQSLTEALNDYIKAPHVQPSDILVKSASLCDDCFKSAEQQLHERHELDQQQQPPATPSSAEPNSVIPSEATDGGSGADDPILPDDDGYCNIDEIRLPAIPPKSAPTSRSDARRQSAPAPLPPSSGGGAAKDEPSSLKSITESLSETSTQDTVKLAGDDSSLGSLHKLPNSSSSTDQSLSISSNSIEANNACDSLSQPMGELSLSDNAKGDGAADTDSPCNKRTMDAFSMPSIPVHVITAYVSALNQHISQLLVSVICSHFVAAPISAPIFFPFYLTWFRLLCPFAAQIERA